MKGLRVIALCLTLLVVGACGGVANIEGTTLTVVEIDVDESNLYSDELKRIIEAHENHPDKANYVSYVIYDIDGDGIPELLTGLTGWGLVCVYAIQNGVAVEQKEFFVDIASDSGHPPPVLLENGTIRIGGKDWEGCISYGYYRFENGELKRQIALQDKSETWWVVNGDEIFKDDVYTRRDPDGTSTSITKAEFKRVQKEFEGDGQVVALDWKPLAEYKGSE